MIHKFSPEARLRYDAYEAFHLALPILKGWLAYKPGDGAIKSNFPRRESGGHTDCPLDCASIVESVVESTPMALQKAVKDYLRYSARDGVFRSTFELAGECEAYMSAIIAIAEHGKR